MIFTVIVLYYFKLYTYVLNKSWDNINKLNHYLELLMNLE